VPSAANITALRTAPRIPTRVVVLNAIAMAIWTVGVFSALYAGYLSPEYRVTASSLSALINGVATILMFMVIDPYLSVMTDDAAEGKISEGYFRRGVVWLTGSRLAGTVLAQLLLVPGASLIVVVAHWL
jgi:hypothetical protein